MDGSMLSVHKWLTVMDWARLMALQNTLAKVEEVIQHCQPLQTPFSMYPDRWSPEAFCRSSQLVSPVLGGQDLAEFEEAVGSHIWP